MDANIEQVVVECTRLSDEEASACCGSGLFHTARDLS